MSISYIKDVPVVFMVQEGTEAPREATEEDFLRAGYLPAAGRGHVSAAAPAAEAVTPPEASKNENPEKEDFEPASCEDCVFLGEDHFLVELVTLPELIGGAVEDLFHDTVDALRLGDLKDGLKKEIFDPLFSFADPKKSEKPAPKEAASTVEDLAGDLFKGAFNVFNTVKDDFARLLDPLDYPEAQKPAAEKSAPVTPEPVKEEEVPLEEKPEFNEFEQTIIGKFEELGLGADAKSAMRKSKEFGEFVSSNKPTAEQAKAFAEMLKNGKPPFFG